MFQHPSLPQPGARNPLSHGGSGRRHAFTLVELLIVMTLIAALMTLTVQVVGAYITSSRESATDTTIRKIHALLNDRAEALYRLTSRTGFVESQSEYANAKLLTTSGFITDGNLQKVLARKLLFRKYFPQSRAEIVDAALYPKLFNSATASSSEVLYDFLTQSSALGPLPEGTDNFSTAEVRDIDNNGLPEFLDAWGHPLRFYRWPTRLFRPGGFWTGLTTFNLIDPSTPRMLLSTLPSFSGDPQADLSRDPDDPLRRCLRYNQFKPGLPPYNGNFEQFTLGGTPCFHTPATYHVMLVVSAGPDGILGLFEPDDFANFGHLGAVKDVNALTDDITVLNVRAGGR